MENGARPRNFLLQQMPEEQYGVFCRQMTHVDMPLGMVLSEPGQPVKFCYFPLAGMVSVDALTERGESVEVGVLGREGVSGMAGVLGELQMGHSVIMQAAGAGLRVRASVVREEFLKGGPFARALHKHFYVQLLQTSQSALCNRLHPVEERMARWLLTASDRIESDVLQLTQEFLAQMLGSRRSTVTVAAGHLQRKGLIDYSRGRIKILDRDKLCLTSCECYNIVRAAYKRVLGDY